MPADHPNHHRGTLPDVHVAQSLDDPDTPGAVPDPSLEFEHWQLSASKEVSRRDAHEAPTLAPLDQKSQPPRETILHPRPTPGLVRPSRSPTFRLPITLSQFLWNRLTKRSNLETPAETKLPGL